MVSPRRTPPRRTLQGGEPPEDAPRRTPGVVSPRRTPRVVSPRRTAQVVSPWRMSWGGDIRT